MNGKRVCKDFEIKNLGEYHDLDLKSDALLLADVFEICREMLSIRSCKKIFSPRITMTSSFKKDQSKIRLFNRY